MIPRNNPTASRGLRSEFADGKASGIKPKYTSLSELRILCASCTVFDQNEKAVKRVELRHEKLHALYRCPICNKAYSEKQIKYVLKLDLPEYIYYDEGSPKDVEEINREREETEKFVIKPINADSPTARSKRKVAKVIK